MKKYIYIGLLLGVFISCGKQKDVKLAEVAREDITEMTDYSAVYFFWNPEKEDSLEVNRNNLITSTNWIFHIDKRLTLEQLTPALIALQEKKENAKMHKNEAAKNYFSVNNKSIKNLSFIDITETQFRFDSQFSKFYIEENPAEFKDKHPFTINFKRDNSVTLDQTPSKKEDIIKFIKEFADFAAPGEKTILYLNFDKHLTFQQYIEDYELIKKSTGNLITIAPIQFVYDEGKLPDCGCTL